MLGIKLVKSGKNLRVKAELLRTLVQRFQLGSLEMSDQAGGRSLHPWSFAKATVAIF
jgi:hypothetical protein